MKFAATRPSRPGLALAAAAFALLCASAAPADVIAERAARVKGAYLLNFARYAQWPPDAFEGDGTPIVIAIVGACDAVDSLVEVIDRSEPVDGRPVAVRRVALSEASEPAPELLDAELVYVCALPPALVHDVLRRLQETGTALTVGDVPGFTGMGGMIGFVLADDRIVFEANLHSIEESRVDISAKVLKLARIAEPQEAP